MQTEQLGMFPDPVNTSSNEHGESLGPDASAESPEYGFSFDESFYNTGFESREAALTAALDEAEGRAFTTARVIPIRFKVPDELAESVSGWLYDRGSFSDIMKNVLLSANEFLDYDGEFDDAIDQADDHELDDAVRSAVAKAMTRHGAVEAARAYLDRTMRDEQASSPEIWSVADDLAKDKQLDAELVEILRSWSDKHGISTAGRGIDVAEPVQHPAPPKGLAA